MFYVWNDLLERRICSKAVGEFCVWYKCGLHFCLLILNRKIRWTAQRRKTKTLVFKAHEVNLDKKMFMFYCVMLICWCIYKVVNFQGFCSDKWHVFRNFNIWNMLFVERKHLKVSLSRLLLDDLFYHLKNRTVIPNNHRFSQYYKF